MSYAVWYPEIGRAHVTTMRGTQFVNMGHSVGRDAPADGTTAKEKVVKRLELLPEEALYLVERGAMFCWKAMEGAAVDDMEGEPMSVQQAFAEMIGKEDLTLEKYHVRTATLFAFCPLLTCRPGLRVSQTPRLCRHTNKASIAGISLRCPLLPSSAQRHTTEDYRFFTCEEAFWLCFCRSEEIICPSIRIRLVATNTTAPWIDVS